MFIIGESTWKNLWNIKVVLREFELISGLCVNFYKSKIYRVGVKISFLQVPSTFLSYSVDNLSFKFLRV